MTSSESLRIEAESYLSLTIVNPQQKERYVENPLECWRGNSKIYPILAQLASVFLDMSAWSSPVESMFSITTHTE